MCYHILKIYNKSQFSTCLQHDDSKNVLNTPLALFV